MTGVNFSTNNIQGYGRSSVHAKYKASRETYSPMEQLNENMEHVLGIGSVYDVNTSTHYGIRAAYAPNSTDGDPIIQVTIQKGGGQTETHDIHIHDIQTSNATDMEMFALCAYADDNGFGTGGTFGSWNTLKKYSENAADNGYGNAAGSSAEDFATRRQNWNDMITRMTSDYADGGLYEQVLDGKALLNMFKGIAKTNTGESDWRTMSCKAWDKLMKNVDDFIEAYKERLKAIHDAQIKAANEAASLAPASHQAAAAQSAWSKVAAMSAMTAGSVDTDTQAKSAAAAYQEPPAGPDSQNTLTKYQEYLLTGKATPGITTTDKTTETVSTSPVDPEEKTWYITAFTQDGIMCNACKKGEDSILLWQIDYKNAGEYEKVTAFLNLFQQDEDLTFASNQNFWKDFLDNKIDGNDFYQFFKSGANGNYDYGTEKNDSLYVDGAKAAYSPYVSPSFFHETEFSVMNLLTGESISVYKGADYTENNPVYIAVGKDANGIPYREEINAKEVDPANCSYLEFSVLTAHLYGNSMTPQEQLSFILMQHESGVSADVRTNYAAIAEKMMNRHQQMNDAAHAAVYEAWIERTQEFYNQHQRTVATASTADPASGKSIYDTDHLLGDVGPNAPEAVLKAWREAAKEAGVDGLGRLPDGRLSHLSQMTVQQVVRWHAQQPDYTDLLGDSVSSAVDAARKALYDLANPLKPDTAHSEAVQEQRLKERLFYEKLIDKLEQVR